MPRAKNLEEIETKNYLLAEIREYPKAPGNRIFLIFFSAESDDEVVLSLKALKEGSNDCFAHQPADGVYDSLLALISKDESKGVLKGLIDQRKGFLRIVLKYFFNVPTKLEITPLEFALCCYDIHAKTKKLITVGYIEKFMREHLNAVNSATNLTAEQIAALKALNAKCFPESAWKKGKNEVLLTYLHDLHQDFHTEYIVKFCKDNMSVIEREVRRFFPLPAGRISFGGPKSAERIDQKFEEYAEQFLAPGPRVYSKFKDFFRASIEYGDYCKCIEEAAEHPDIAAINYRTEGEYQACYIILSINTLNVELKVVKSLAALQESHDWYELKRNDTIENLESFIARGIAKLPAQPMALPVRS